MRPRSDTTRKTCDWRPRLASLAIPGRRDPKNESLLSSPDAPALSPNHYVRDKAICVFNLFRVEFPAACGVASTRVLRDTSLLAAGSFIHRVIGISVWHISLKYKMFLL
jgi:hypothetical protein